MFGVYAKDGRLVASYGKEDVAKTAAPTYGCDPLSVKPIPEPKPSPPGASDPALEYDGLTDDGRARAKGEALAMVMRRIDNVQAQLNELRAITEANSQQLDLLHGAIGDLESGALDDDARDLDGTVGNDQPAPEPSKPGESSGKKSDKSSKKPEKR